MNFIKNLKNVFKSRKKKNKTFIDENNELIITDYDIEDEELESDIYVKKFTGDFETCTWLESETWVWAWALCEIGNEENLIIDNNIDSFMEFCRKEPNAQIYFHNLKFDGEFIIYWLLKNGFTHVKSRKEAEDKTFTTLISNMGQFYNIVVYFKKGNKSVNKVTFIDSLKIIPFSVDQTAKSFGLPISKLKIDYNKIREPGHIITDEEKDYIKNDVLIMAKALKVIFDEGLTRMTRASNALFDYTEIIGKGRFDNCFPKLNKDIDEKIRKAYKGGFTYLNPIYKEKDVENVVNLDVNSLYPYVMYSRSLPYGEPKHFEGKYKEDKLYSLYIQRITCSFKVKKNKIPTIQIKNNISFIGNEYLESSDNEIVLLTLTNIDLDLFLEHYEVYNLQYIDGWAFKSINGLFKSYIDKWIERKNNATIEGNLGQRTLAKQMLNALYGKFAKSMELQSKYPYIENDVVRYSLSEKEDTEGLYIPIACFITAYAREITIRTSQKIKEYSINKYKQDMYIYSDTDSIKTLLPIEELVQFCNIDDVELGAWKNEGIATRGKWIRQKCYLEEIDGNIHITCAGMPKSCYSQVEWDKFKTGFTCSGKLTFKHIKGGVKLVETDFTIKDDKVRKNIDKFNKK